MASNFNLQDTVNWCEPFMSGKPLFLGAINQPALTSANIVLQTILSPPFTWRWNRAEAAPFNTVVGNTDNAAALADFGFIERAFLKLAQQPTYEIPNIKDSLGPASASEEDRPHTIAAQLDDNAGNITFRVNPAYDQIYSAVVMYQKKAPIMLSLASTWSPMPDEMSFIYNHGFLAMCLLFDDDARFQIINSKFVAALLSSSQGLSEMQRNIFAERWTTQVAQAETAGLKARQGVQARSQI